MGHFHRNRVIWTSSRADHIFGYGIDPAGIARLFCLGNKQAVRCTVYLCESLQGLLDLPITKFEIA